ncbi:hypothetical protein D3C86_1700070 [compost metagenome]
MDDTDELPDEVWVDPNESIPAEIPTTWAFTALAGLPLREVAIWVEAETLEEAQALFEGNCVTDGSPPLAVARYLPDNLAVHLRWLNAADTTLYAVLRRD